MAWVRFTDDFDWKPKKSVTVAYRAEMVLNVPIAASRAAIAANKAVAMRKEHRDAEPVEIVNDDR